ncbi:MAG: GNAT family N-acetyltransferase [Chloroflexi bacterium]|nr:GNAT family N-acetyltransferase [Chloroflexota bacterium]
MQAVAVQIRPFETRDYDAVAALNNVNFPEFTSSADEIRYDDEHRPAHCRWARWIAECDERVVGGAQYEQYAGAYNPRKFSIQITVDPTLHNRGIGGRLYAALIDALREFDPISMNAMSREDMFCRVAFLQHRGFREEQRDWSSELDLDSFDATPFRKYVDSMRSKGFVVRTLADLLANQELDERELFDLWVEVQDDVPSPPSMDRTRRTFEDWRTRNLEHVSLFPEAYFIALDGTRYVGTTQMWRAPEKECLRTGLTGVRRAYRGRGIAFALKVVALEFAKQRGYGRVDTENESRNVGMLSINERLGFVKRPAWVHYVAEWSAASRA